MAVQLTLCGQTPEVALSSALNAVQFYITQQALQADLQAARLHQKLDKMRVQCNARLQEVHDGYVKVSWTPETALKHLGRFLGWWVVWVSAGQTQVQGHCWGEKQIDCWQSRTPAKVFPKGRVSPRSYHPEFLHVLVLKSLMPTITKFN
jgi:hypothetical protein